MSYAEKTKAELLTEVGRLEAEVARLDSSLTNEQARANRYASQERDASARANAAIDRETALLREKNEVYGSGWAHARTKEAEYLDYARTAETRAAALRGALIIATSKEKADQVDPPVPDLATPWVVSR